MLYPQEGFRGLSDWSFNLSLLFAGLVVWADGNLVDP